MPSRFFCLLLTGKKDCLWRMWCNNLAIISILYIILFGDNMKQYLEIGKLVNTHGIKGELKLDLWCDDIDYVKQFETVYLDDKGSKALTPVAVRPQKNMAIIKFAEITSIEQAEEYKNKIIYGNRDDAVIDDDANYIADLIGCRVVDIQTETTTREPFTRVDEDKTAAPIVIKLTPQYGEGFKRNYKVGENADFSGLTVTAVYDNGTQRQIPLSECNVYGFSTDTAANRIVTVEYEGCSFSYLIRVEEAK